MKRIPLAACAVALTVSGLVPFGLSPAAADTASAGRAQGFGANANLSGSPLIDRAGLAEVTLPPGGVAGPEELILLDQTAPIAVSGTAVGVAGASAASTLTSTLAQTQQAVQGPYNLAGVGLVEDLDVLAGTPTPVPPLPDIGVSLVSASAVRGEAVGVCRAGVAQYSADSEVADLQVGGTPLIENATLEDLVDTLNDVLQPLSFVVDIERNEVSELPGGGIQVNALHVTVLGGIGATTPVLDLVVGHAEVGGLQCPATAQCADGQDNDGDGVIDAQDPGCINNGVYDPNDNDERNECVDTVDNDGDGRVDFGPDPGCESPQDDDERDLPRTAELPRTGGDLTATAPISIGLSVLAFAALALRRRSQA